MNAEGIISLVLAIFMLGCGCVTKSSMDVDFQKKILFSDDFDSNAGAWTQDSNSWSIENGEYVVSLSGYGVAARAFIKEKVFSDFMLELSTRRDICVRWPNQSVN